MCSEPNSALDKKKAYENLIEGYKLEPIDEKVRVVMKPGWFLKILYPLHKALGASSPGIRVWLTGIFLFAPELILLIFNAFYPNLGLVIVMMAYLIFLGGHFVLAFILHFLGLIIIRKECDQCQFRFYIIAHEKNHLKLNSLDDELVEKETLKQTGSKLFPIILSKPMQSTFIKVRKRVAYKLQNPRILRISYVTFRHWGATMVYHYSRGGLLLVQKLLGHKRITSTMKYTQLIQFKDDEYDVATATTIEEAKTIVAAGYDYVTEKQGITLFKRPKRFGSMTLSR
jgi:hypothetical protein